MRRLQLFVAVAGALFAASNAAVCQSKEPPKPDPRLQEKRLTLSETRVTLQELLKLATQQSGIVMRPDPGDDAWKVRELPVSVHVKDMTVAEFQRQLARLLDLRWVRGGAEGAWTYRLWQDKNAREREADALNAKANERLNKTRKQWQDGFDKIARAQQLPPEELEKAAADDPFLRFAAMDPFGKAYAGLIASLGPAAIANLASGQPYSVPFSQLSAPQQAHTQQFVTGLKNLMGRTDGDRGVVIPDNWQETQVVFRPLPTGVGHDEMERVGMMGMMQVTGGGGRTFFPIIDPNSKLAGLMAQGVGRVSSGESPETVMRDIMGQMEQVLRRSQTQTAVSDEGKTAKAEETDPRLLKEVELKPGDVSDPVAALKPLNDDPGLNIIAEGWRQLGRGGQQDKGRVKDILDRTASAMRMSWQLDGSTIRLKADDWAERRARMVAQEDIAYWTERAKSAGGLSLDDLAEMAVTYSPEQLTELMAADQNIARGGWPLMMAERKRALIFYAGLDTGRRTRALSDAGLDPFDMTDAQHLALAQLLEAQGIRPDDFFLPGSSVRIVEREGSTNLVLDYPPDRSKDIPLVRRNPPAPGGPPQRTQGGEEPH